MFNSLNNIYSLAVVQSDKTAEMVLRLSNLLRYVVYEGKAKCVTLRDEIEQIEAFIELFQMKSEHPLNISFEKKGEVSDQEIEPMILIPIVENCFKHCDFNENADAFIEIRLHLEQDTLYFQTRNTKNDADKQKDQVVEGLKEYVRFVCKEARFVTLESLKNLEAILPQGQFIRVHKSFIVAKQYVQSVEGNQLAIGQQKIPISRSKREAIVQAIFYK